MAVKEEDDLSSTNGAAEPVASTSKLHPGLTIKEDDVKVRLLLASGTSSGRCTLADSYYTLAAHPDPLEQPRHQGQGASSRGRRCCRARQRRRRLGQAYCGRRGSRGDGSARVHPQGQHRRAQVRARHRNSSVSLSLASLRPATVADLLSLAPFAVKEGMEVELRRVRPSLPFLAHSPQSPSRI